MNACILLNSLYIWLLFTNRTVLCLDVQSCLTLCDPMDCSWPGSSVHGILQARILKWVTMPSSSGSSQPKHWTSVFYVSCIGRWVLYHSHHLRSPNGVLLSNKEEWSIDTFYNVDEPWEHYAKEKKKTRHKGLSILYALIYMKCQLYRDKRRLVFGRA